VAGLPSGEDTPLAAGDVDVPPVAEDPFELVGADVTGVLTTGALATGAGITAAAGATDAGKLEEMGVVAWTTRRVAVCAGVVLTLTSTTRIGGALLRATGIAVPADAAGSLGGNCSAGAAAGRSARPISKQQANTAAHSSIETAPART
jgi:hypothetical protein